MEDHQGVIYHQPPSPKLLIPAGCVSTDRNHCSTIVWSKKITKDSGGRLVKSIWPAAAVDELAVVIVAQMTSFCKTEDGYNL